MRSTKPVIAVLVCTLGYVWSFRIGAVSPPVRILQPVSFSSNDIVTSQRLQLSKMDHFPQPVVDTKLAPVPSTIRAVWDFTRPHTIIGSCISIISLYLFAVPQSLWKTPAFAASLLSALFPSLLMNLYITGLNQVTDIGIDKINKPYLPLASGALSPAAGVGIVLASLALSLANIKSMAWPLQYTLLGSALLGTAYSLPPFRLKRFPLLAAM
jgi:4-hydroxybenzoate polyprenyltransferase